MYHKNIQESKRKKQLPAQNGWCSQNSVVAFFVFFLFVQTWITQCERKKKTVTRLVWNDFTAARVSRVPHHMPSPFPTKSNAKLKTNKLRLFDSLPYEMRA